MEKIFLTVILIGFAMRGVSQQFIPSQKTVSGKIVVKEIIEKQLTISNKDALGNFISDKKNEKGMVPDSIQVIQRDTLTIAKIGKKYSFGIFGTGNVNKEQLEKFNASGKFSCFIKPLIQPKSELTFFLSFNKNATNNDSLLASTLIFPEVGNNSFLGTVELARLMKQEVTDTYLKEHYIVPFIEFSNKNVKASQDTGNAKLASYYFSTLNYTVGCKYLFHFSKMIDSAEHNVDFSLTGYLSYLNIPNQDTADYRILLRSKTISDNLWAVGLKIGVQYNNFSIFADFRHVLGSDKRVPVRELRGFNSNIGVIFNAEIFKF